MVSLPALARLRSSLLHGLLLLVCCAGFAAAQEPPRRGWWRVEVPETESYSFRYIPFSVDLDAGPLPVIIFLHGSGSAPEPWQLFLQPLAEALEVALIVPRAASNLAFGVGADDRTLDAALADLRGVVAVDPARVGIAGHSAGGAYAYVLAYQRASRFNGVFILSSPYRTVLNVVDPDYTAPLRMYYGTQDPNYQGGSYTALRQQFQRLGVAVEEEIRPGFGHNDWPDSTLRDGFQFLLEQRYGTAGGCVPAPQRLCLGEGRFAAEVEWHTVAGESGVGQVAPARTADSGLFWFFQPDNWEMQVKVLDACAFSGHFWVFASATTNVEYTLRVTDLQTGQVRTYTNPQGQTALTVTDTAAFKTCP
jgi:pimeloyl-ACP methyl ester carboxylesterase